MLERVAWQGFELQVPSCFAPTQIRGSFHHGELEFTSSTLKLIVRWMSDRGLSLDHAFAILNNSFQGELQRGFSDESSLEFCCHSDKPLHGKALALNGSKRIVLCLISGHDDQTGARDAILSSMKEQSGDLYVWSLLGVTVNLDRSFCLTVSKFASGIQELRFSEGGKYSFRKSEIRVIRRALWTLQGHNASSETLDLQKLKALYERKGVQIRVSINEDNSHMTWIETRGERAKEALQWSC